jgi:hypothetical protein
MRLLRWNLEVLQSSGCRDYGLDLMLAHEFLIGGCVEVTEYEFACLSDGVCGENYVVGAVFLLCIIIMKHELL